MSKKLIFLSSICCGLLFGAVAATTNVTPVATIATTADVSNAITTAVETVTAEALSGYGVPFTEWTVGGTYPDDGTYPTIPEYDGTQWVWSYTNISTGAKTGDGSSAATEDAIQIQPSGISAWWFTRDGIPQYTNLLGLATISNLTQYVKVLEFQRTLKGYVTQADLNNYDASYKMVSDYSTENQTIQYLSFSESNAPNPVLAVEIPVNGRCKDWIIYCETWTNTPISLPPYDINAPMYWWVSDEADTNDLTEGCHALYFSQVTDTPMPVYTIGRREFKPIAPPQPANPEQTAFLNAMKRAALLKGRKYRSVRR